MFEGHQSSFRARGRRPTAGVLFTGLFDVLGEADIGATFRAGDRLGTGGAGVAIALVLVEFTYGIRPHLLRGFLVGSREPRLVKVGFAGPPFGVVSLVLGPVVVFN